MRNIREGLKSFRDLKELQEPSKGYSSSFEFSLSFVMFNIQIYSDFIGWFAGVDSLTAVGSVQQNRVQWLGCK
jgi:hypothetical protein